jgi:hypothetical protein
MALRERALVVPRRIAAATGFDLDEITELQGRLNRLTAALNAAALDEDLSCAGGEFEK